MAIDVRSLEPQDRAVWDPLWLAYLRFYEKDLDDAVTDASWARFFDPAEPVGALGAWIDGDLVGFCHHVFHRSTWVTTTTCYLEDLFTSPAARGRGVGRALIEETAQLATDAGAENLYWHTQEGNATARSLYDQVATDLCWVVYEREL